MELPLAAVKRRTLGCETSVQDKDHNNLNYYAKMEISDSVGKEVFYQRKHSVQGDKSDIAIALSNWTTPFAGICWKSIAIFGTTSKVCKPLQFSPPRYQLHTVTRIVGFRLTGSKHLTGSTIAINSRLEVYF